MWIQGGNGCERVIMKRYLAPHSKYWYLNLAVDKLDLCIHVDQFAAQTASVRGAGVDTSEQQCLYLNFYFLSHIYRCVSIF